MTEFRSSSESQHHDDISEIALRVGNSLLREREIVKLTVDDLRNRKTIPENQTFTDFMIGRLGLSTSLQSEAIDRLVSRIPPPTDAFVAHKALNGQILTFDEELSVKKSIILRESNDLLLSLEDASKSEREEFTQMVLERSSVWRDGNSSSFDPEKVKNDPDMIREISSSDPEVIDIKGDSNKHFALRVPKEPDKNIAKFILSVIRHDIDRYVMVADPNQNSELTDYIFNHPNLLRYNVIKLLQDIEIEKMYDLDAEFTRASQDKYNKAKKEVEPINFSLKKHAFGLLKKDAKKKGKITLVEISRDKQDMAVFKGEISPKKDRPGSESSTRVYTVSAEEDVLVFDFEDEKKYPVRYYARVNSEKNKLEYGTKNANGEIVWKDDGTLHYKINGGKNFYEGTFQESVLSSIEAISATQKIQYGESGVQESQRLIGELLKTQSSIEFFSKSREYGISGYPQKEIIVDTEKRLHYPTDQFPQNLQEDFSRN